MRKSDLKKLIDSSKELQQRALVLEQINDLKTTVEEIKIMSENNRAPKPYEIEFVNNRESLLSKHMLTTKYPFGRSKLFSKEEDISSKKRFSS